jgi:hypothetical protein
LHQQLLSDDPIAVLEPLPDEIPYARRRLRLLAKRIEDELAVEPLTRLLPFATGTVAATRSRAQLFFKDPRLEIPPRLVATLILQGRLLTDGDNLSTMRVHPHSVFHIARGLWLSALAMNPERRDELGLINEELDRIKRSSQDLTERLLARCRIGSVRDGETVALVFCAGTLALGPLDPRYVVEALASAANGQSDRGDWSQGRVIAENIDPDTGGRLIISSHEVGLAFAEAIFCLGLVPGVAERLSPEVTAALRQAVDYLRESRVPLVATHPDTPQETPVVGWAPDHIYGRTQIDTRATAAALRLTITTRGVSEQERSVRALAHFDDVWDPSDHTPDYLVWPDYVEKNEPDSRNPILPYLDKHFVQYARKTRAEDRRPWARTEAMSAILFGPPGTTKTTIVKSMAQGLEWPLVTLSPGTFIRDGLENVERRAIEVFSHLQDLIRVVVLFDECDELFRARRHAQDNQGNDEMRSISAFMTASMLPKLQDLRDNGQAFFVIVTNYFDQIDSAAKRIGRIDRVVGVSWPDTTQRTQMIRRQLVETAGSEVSARQPVVEAIDALAADTRYFVRGELIELANELAPFTEDLQSSDVEKTVEQVRAGKSPSIDKEDCAAFKRDAAERSACHTAMRGELKDG